MASIQIKRGTRAQIESAKTANGLLNGEPYLITDESRLAVGTGVSVYSDCAKKSEVDAKEPSLGNPASDGMVLSSTAAGVRSWAGMSSTGMVLLATATASDVTSVDFTSITSTYDEYEIHCINIIPTTDAIDLYIRTSSNGGGSFDSGASDYSWVMYESTVIYDGTYGGLVYGNNADPYIRITRNGVGNASGKYGYNGVIKLFKPSSATVYKSFVFTGMYQSVSHVINHIHGAGQRLSSSEAVNAIRFLFSSGNISSGEFKLYGIIKSL